MDLRVLELETLYIPQPGTACQESACFLLSKGKTCSRELQSRLAVLLS